MTEYINDNLNLSMENGKSNPLYLNDILNLSFDENVKKEKEKLMKKALKGGDEEKNDMIKQLEKTIKDKNYLIEQLQKTIEEKNNVKERAFAYKGHLSPKKP